MQLHSLLTATIALTPLAVSAAGTLGFAVGNVDVDSKCKTQQEYEDDFAAIKENSHAEIIRTYSSSDMFGNPCNTPSVVLPAAKAAGVKVLLGLW